MIRTIRSGKNLTYLQSGEKTHKSIHRMDTRPEKTKLIINIIPLADNLLHWKNENVTLGCFILGICYISDNPP